MKKITKIFFLSFILHFGCENNPTVYEDCNGIPNGASTEDNCGVCDNNPLNDCLQDCIGIWGGNATTDACGVCDDNPNNNGIPDCNDPEVCIIPDEYGSYNAIDMDCNGICGGNAQIDICGRCNGDGESYLCGCDTIPDGDCDCNGNKLDCNGECEFNYVRNYRCDSDNSLCDPNDSTACDEGECNEALDLSDGTWISNTSWTGAVIDDCGNCIDQNLANYFTCANGDICNPDNQNECLGEYACNDQSDCLLRSTSGDCDCLNAANSEYNYYGECGGAFIDSSLYDCEYNCTVGLDDCGVCGGSGSIGNICACTEMKSNSLTIVEDDTIPNKMYLLYKSDDPIFGIQVEIDGTIITSASGGDASSAGFILQAAGNTLLSFSFGGESVSAGCGILAELTVQDANSFIGIKNTTFSWHNMYSYNDLLFLESIVNDNSNCNVLERDDNGILWVDTNNSFIGKITSLTIDGNTNSECNINSLPSNISNLTQLKTLDLSNNQLTNLPSEIVDLNNLQYLNLSGNNFTTFPPELCNINNLNLIIDNFDYSVECE